MTIRLIGPRLISPVDPAHCINYPDNAGSVEFFQAYKRESFTLMNLKEGHCALDVGCGAGEDAISMAQIVGNTGRIVGIDNSETIIDIQIPSAWHG